MTKISFWKFKKIFKKLENVVITINELEPKNGSEVIIKIKGTYKK